MRDLNKFATAHWSRDADIVTIARCILGTLKYEPHTCDVTALRQVLEARSKARRGNEAVSSGQIPEGSNTQPR